MNTIQLPHHLSKFVLEPLAPVFQLVELPLLQNPGVLHLGGPVEDRRQRLQVGGVLDTRHLSEPLELLDRELFLLIEESGRDPEFAVPVLMVLQSLFQVLDPSFICRWSFPLCEAPPVRVRRVSNLLAVHFIFGGRFDLQDLCPDCLLFSCGLL